MPDHSENRTSGSPTGSPRGRREAAAYFSAIVLIGAAVTAIVIVAVSGGGGSSEGSAVAAFEPDYADLAVRREAAGVSTMGDPEDASAHFHPRLDLYANGEQVQIPVNIGIAPGEPGQKMASLHTHESDGTIHVEGMPDPTLGQFFEIWGVPLSSEQLGPYRTEGAKTVRMWVDGEPSQAFGELPLHDGQEIVVAYGTKEQLPPGLSP